MSLYEMIGDIPLFKNFSEKDKKTFAKMDHSVLAFSKGDVIIKEGELYTSLYLLIRGSARVTRNGYDSPVAVLKAGSVFGEISFLTRRARQSNVIANENILAIKIDDAFFEKLDYKLGDAALKSWYRGIQSRGQAARIKADSELSGPVDR